MKKISVLFFGGLGNQLLQLALAKTLKEKLEKEILDHFEDKYHLSSAELKESLEMKYRYYLKRNMKMKERMCGYMYAMI